MSNTWIRMLRPQALEAHLAPDKLALLTAEEERLKAKKKAGNFFSPASFTLTFFKPFGKFSGFQFLLFCLLG